MHRQVDDGVLATAARVPITPTFVAAEVSI
jgi:hypothetical protein